MSRRKTREELTPDLTPLIDVVFILLVFFMVTSVFRKDESSLDLNLPKTAMKKQEIIERPAVIEMSVEKVALNGKELPLENLIPTLKMKTDTSKVVMVKIDKDVRYERFSRLIEQLKQANYRNLDLILAMQNAK